MIYNVDSKVLESTSDTVKKGLAYLRAEKGILGLILFLAAINLVASIYDAAFPAMMLSREGGSELAILLFCVYTKISHRA